ncbi:MAG TPA: YkgJ family cysteine cluster protein [Verrucomicrobia bacterium]|nr:YkgJ family cysteine cluster protein [Verrucomicrobiota bacterium]
MISSPASRLCEQCGMCCNGVLFLLVQLQPQDLPVELASLGVKLKRKNGKRYIQQPCPAYGDSGCSIYSQRPERCRLFECRQLRGVISGSIPESDAVTAIQKAVKQVETIEQLFSELGDTNKKRPYLKRLEKVQAKPVDRSADPKTAALRSKLETASKELESMLDQGFRV